MRMIVVGYAAGALAGCGGTAVETTVDLCNRWLAVTVCGEFDFSTVVDCGVFAEPPYTKCYLDAYFECLTENTTCDAAASFATVDFEACTEEGACE